MKGTPVVEFGGNSNVELLGTNAEDVRSGGGCGGKRMRSGRPNGVFVFGALMIFLLVFATQSSFAEAKRGCANFGHSCYGGMGKRANALNEEYTSQEGNSIDGEVDPALVFTGPRSVLRPLTAQRLLQQRQEYIHDKMAADDKMAHAIDFQNPENVKFSPYLKQLLQFYRNMQLQNQRDGPIEQ
ncbi:uncharacterized protein CCHa2 isoform X2 [Atheta coriaria]|uniref:uncharacterized protein CCHa2 isoform X2 n=1 Tax=Dalotia coriaria TaxID=877792 RepID=UPI0031F39BFD